MNTAEFSSVKASVTALLQICESAPNVKELTGSKDLTILQICNTVPVLQL